MEKLGDTDIERSLKQIPEWNRVGESIQRTYKVTDFVRAMQFVNRVAQQAEVMQHHPDILIRWNLVTLTLTTHDATPGGGLTQKDFDLARICDGFVPIERKPNGAGQAGATSGGSSAAGTSGSPTAPKSKASKKV